MRVCIICNSCEENSVNNPISVGCAESLITIKKYYQLRKENGEIYFNKFLDESVGEIEEECIVYHRKCYQNFTNKSNFSKSSSNRESVSSTFGKRKSENLSENNTKKILRSTINAAGSDFKMNLCLFCQQDTKHDLHSVSSKNMMEKILVICCESENPVHKFVHNIINSSSNLELKYHRDCMRYMQRSTNATEPCEIDESLEVNYIMASCELLAIIEEELRDPSKILCMNEVLVCFCSILESYEIPIPSEKYLKIKIKRLINEKLPNILFIKSKQRNLSEKLITLSKISTNQRTETDLQDIYSVIIKAATAIRDEVNNFTPWKFTGTFKDYKNPPMLKLFFNHAIAGKKTIKHKQRKEDVHKDAEVLCQHFVQVCRTARQVNYEPSNEISIFRTIRETPIAVALPLFYHMTSRSRKEIEILSNIKLGINYKRLLNLESDIASAISKHTDESGQYCVPQWIVKNVYPYFGADNVDFQEAVVAGKNTLHGTILVMYQRKIGENNNMMIISRDNNKSEKHRLECEFLPCEKPLPKKEIMNFVEPISNETVRADKKDMAWLFSCLNLNDSSDCFTTWNAFNSILSKHGQKTNVGVVSPLFRSSPTEYSTLYTVMIRAKSITTDIMGPGYTTVMSFDLQLYDMAIKLWFSNDLVRSNFLFRPGELHTVFWSLSALGKYIEGSGIDQAWVEVGMYAPITVTRILEGKQYYRAIEAHSTTVIALISSFFKRKYSSLSLLNQNTVECLINKIQQVIAENMNKNVDENCDDLTDQIIFLWDEINNIVERDLFEITPDSSYNERFLINYIIQFKCILRFIRGTRENNIDLHLEATRDLMKYFFAHNNLNYARLSSVYLWTMQNLRDLNPTLWNEFKSGNVFSVSKQGGCFTSIAPDHAHEQEIKIIKGQGGVIGITQNEECLDKFFTIAPELKNIFRSFKEQYLPSDNKHNKHHEITGGMADRMKENQSKLVNIFTEFDILECTDKKKLVNILSQQTIHPSIAENIIKRDELGEELCKTFLEERLIKGTKSVWDPMKRSKISTFTTVMKKTEDKVQIIKEERNLLQRLIVVARSRSDLNFKECIGEFEFGLVPRSLFSSSNILLLANDKSKMVPILEKLYEKPISQGNVNLITTDSSKVILIDGMAYLHCIKKDKKTRTFEDLSKTFIEYIIKKTSGFNYVHLIFDRYIKNSLKEQTRNKRSKGMSLKIKVQDNVIIENISMSELLNNIETKHELTIYLAEKVLNYFAVHSIHQIVYVTAGTETKNNINSFIDTHNQEEADTILLLQATTINKDFVLYVDSPDTDVLLLLIYYYEHIPEKTYFLTGKLEKRRTVDIKSIHDALGKDKVKALLGMHALTGSDMSGKFFGKTKEKCMHIFLKTDTNSLEGLAMLGENNFDLQNNLKLIEEFVCKLYNSPYKTVKETRWFLYSSKQSQGEALPPTEGALHEHIYRAHLVCKVWKTSHMQHPPIPNPLEFGWKIENEKFVPIMTKSSPAPKGILELTKCNCKKGCSNNLCSCKQQGLCCTDLCGCLLYECFNIPKPSSDDQLYDDPSDFLIDNFTLDLPFDYSD